MTKLITVFLLLLSQSTWAENCISQRELFIENTVTKVWKTILCPKHKLPFRVHHHSRVVIPEETGSLKITYQSSREDIITLKKQIPLYLSVAQGKEPHQEENLGQEPLHVTVIELKND